MDATHILDDFFDNFDDFRKAEIEMLEQFHLFEKTLLEEYLWKLDGDIKTALWLDWWLNWWRDWRKEYFQRPNENAKKDAKQDDLTEKMILDYRKWLMQESGYPAALNTYAQGIIAILDAMIERRQTSKDATTHNAAM